jgi:hypothetical protein
MKGLFLLITTLCLTHISFAQTVPLDSVKFYEGKTITVCAKVQGTFESNGAKKNIYLSFGKPYPNATFTVIIFEGDLTNFKYKPADFLKDKEICVSGKVEFYKDKPQIVVKKEEQIKVK